MRRELDVALARLACAAASGSPTDDLAGDVLDLAEPEGFVFPVPEAGGAVLAAVRRVARRRALTPFVSALLRTTPHAVPPTCPTPEFAADALTQRERVVLRYLATTLSYREIADDLFVSVNTVKTHAKNITRKLHASSRADAIARATAQHYL